MGYYIMEGGANVPQDVFVVAGKHNNGRIEVYSPVGQHSEIDEDYLGVCTEITKATYLDISKNYYTPMEYL